MYKFKALLLLFALLYTQMLWSQVGIADIGKKDFYSVKRSFDISPCEVTNNQVLTYCVENGSRLSFLFANQTLNGIMYMTAFATRNAAERELETEISNEKKSLGIEPFITNGKVIFNTLDSPIFISYAVEYTNGTYFLVQYISKK
jgi:hypothetical protein